MAYEKIIDLVIDDDKKPYPGSEHYKEGSNYDTDLETPFLENKDGCKVARNVHDIEYQVQEAGLALLQSVSFY